MTCMELLGDSSKSSLTLYSKTALLLVEGMPWYKAGPRSSSLNDPKISIGSRGCFRAEDSQQLKAMAQVGVTVSLDKFLKDSEVFSTASPDASVETLRTALEEDYEVKKVLGQGKFGLVQEVVKKSTKHRFAVKVVPSSKQSEDEIQILASLRHGNIVCLHDSLEHDEMLYIILELCRGGTLKSWIEDRRDEHFHMQVYTAPPKRILANCLWQILDALKYLHGRGFVHRDVKLENLLLLNAGPCPQLKLADFGMATECQQGELMTQRCGTPGYMAPEVVRGGYTELCDLWSVGVVFYQMATGKRLWPLTQTHEQHYDQVLAEADTLTLKSNAYWSRFGPGALELAQDLLSLEFTRPTAACAIENDWLRKHVAGAADGCCSIS